MVGLEGHDSIGSGVGGVWSKRTREGEGVGRGNEGEREGEKEGGRETGREGEREK